MPFKLGNLIRNRSRGNSKTIQGEAKFQAIFNNAGDSIFMVDPSFSITDVNESACKLLHYSREELLIKKMYELMTTGDQVTFIDRVKIIDKQGGSVHERKLKRKDGSWVDIEVDVRPVEGVGYIAIIRDITERKKAEAKILERESLLTALFNNIEGSIALYDANKKIVLFNSHFADNYKLLTNHYPEIGDGAHDFLSEEMKKDPAKMMDNALKGNKEVFEKDYLSNGKMASFRTSFNPVINNGKVTGITSFSLDLTKNKEAEIKIRENEEKFRVSFMTSKDTFYIGTLNEGRIIDVNDSFYELYGYTREESIGKTTMELNIYAYPLDRARMIAELRTNGSLKDLELTCRKKNGELMIVSVTANVWQLNNEQVLMAVIRDITERKRVEKELVESEVRFREVLENSLSASYKRNLQTNTYDYLSPVFKKIAGYTQDELNSLPLEIVIGMMHPDDVQVVNEGITRAIAEPGGIEHALEYRFKHKTTGGYRWLNDEFVVIKDAKGQAISLIGSVSDITERKGIETELIESKEQMALFVEYSPASLAMFDNEMRYVATSRRWLIDYNLGDQDIIGKTHYEVFPEVGQDWRDIHQRCLNGAIERREEDSFTRVDGTTDWLKWEIRPWHKASGEIAGIIMFTEVITEQKESELKFKNLVEKSLVGVYIMQHGKFAYVNPKFAQDMGYTQEEMLNMEDGREIVDENYKPDELIQWRKKVGAGIIDDIHIELKYKRKDGVIIWGEVYCGETFYKGGKAIIGTFQDITERKNAETIIKEQAEIFSAIIENANESIWLLSPDMEVLQYNKTAKERLLTSRGKEVHPGADFKEFLYKGTERVFISGFKNAVAGKNIEQESSVLNNDGQLLWLRTKMYPVYDTQKNLIGVTVLSENITDRKNTEALIQEQAETFSAIIENAHESIFLISPDLKVLQFNKTASDRILLNGGKEIYLGADLRDFLYTDSDNVFMPMFNDALAGKYTERESRQANIDGKMFWLRTSMSPVYDTNKKLIGVTVLAENITDRKKAEERIKQSEANYRQLFDNSPAPMWVIDEKTSAIVQVNQACIKTYGYSQEEFVGMTISDISPDYKVPGSKKNINDLFFMGSQRHAKRSGELIDVVTSSIPIILNGEKNILLTAIDVTEKNLYEQKLAKAAIKVQEDERYEIGGELHDNVCQLLVASLMLLGMIKISLPEKSIETYNEVREHISEATDEIRNLSHRLAPVFFDGETLEEALMGLLKTFNVENNYTISLVVDARINEQSLNRDLQLNLYRVLQEQLRNIMKHARATDIKIKIAMKDNMLQMRITDNGVGFDPQTKRGGIGLANMNRRVQLFSGSFTINSSAGKGCEVLVDIPLPDTDQ